MKNLFSPTLSFLRKFVMTLPKKLLDEPAIASVLSAHRDIRLLEVAAGKKLTREALAAMTELELLQLRSIVEEAKRIDNEQSGGAFRQERDVEAIIARL